ncbi:MAG: conjugal transfer protein TraG, partial [Sphingomonas sp.]
DWSDMVPVAAPPAPEPAPQQPSPPGTEASASDGATKPTDTITDNANAGIRREPELGVHEDIAPTPKAPEGEFDFDGDAAQEDAAQARRAADRLAAGNARRASLDPNDGIEL